MVAADVEHLAETISGDKPKLRTHCELGELPDQTQEGVYEKDARAIDALAPRLTPSNNGSVLSMTK
jgi:hypothetical protein